MGHDARRLGRDYPRADVGVVVTLAVAVGDAVRASDVVCVLEAMKMESPLRAGTSGRVVEISVAEGQGVAPGEVLLRIE